MTGKEMHIPLYAKASIIIIGLLAAFTVLNIAQNIIVPIVFAVIIAVVLHPVVNLLIHIKINRVLAIVIVISLTFLVITTFGILLARQVSRLSDSWPLLGERLTEIINKIIDDASIHYDIYPEKVNSWIETARQEFFDMLRASIGQSLVIIGNGLVFLFLVPVYVFMFLFYQPLLRDFIFKLFSESKRVQVGRVFSQTKVVIQRYLVGLVLELIIVAILNIAALLILGIEYAVLLGIAGALLNIIPYLGGLISVALFMFVALVTKSPEYMLYVIAAYTVIQFIDNNYIVPKIVASKVKINALFSIIVVIAGNALWGIPGMFLSIPILAIVKLIFDNIESLKPWGFLLGDTMPPILKIKPIFKKKIPMP